MSGSPETPTGWRDPATAAERTAMAWERTGFGLIGIGGLVAHAGRDQPGAKVATGLVVLALGAGLSLVWAPARYRAIMREAGAGRNPRPQAAALRLLTVAVVLLALASSVLL